MNQFVCNAFADERSHARNLQQSLSSAFGRNLLPLCLFIAGQPAGSNINKLPPLGHRTKLGGKSRAAT